MCQLQSSVNYSSNHRTQLDIPHFPWCMLTMSSTVACAHWPRPWSWSCWSSSWPASSSRGQAGHGLLLLHPRHWSFPLNGHLKVVWQGLSPSQHLISHDLGSELVELVLVEGSGATGASRTSRACRTTRLKASSKAGDTSSEIGSRAGTWVRATWRTRTVIRTQCVLISTGAIQRCRDRARATRGRGRGGGWHKRTRGGAV